MLMQFVHAFYHYRKQNYVPNNFLSCRFVNFVYKIQKHYSQFWLVSILHFGFFNLMTILPASSSSDKQPFSDTDTCAN